jgi:lipoprotein-anchoring transpeptidase ErfK/SrfK
MIITALTPQGPVLRSIIHALVILGNDPMSACGLAHWEPKNAGYALMVPLPARKPTIFEVNIELQTVTVIGRSEIYQCQCIAGDKYNPTQKGRHVVYRKSRYHVSNQYGSKMYFAMFFYKGQALHQYHGLGWPLLYYGKKAIEFIGSHGCVRLQEADAEKLYGWAVEYETVVHVF